MGKRRNILKRYRRVQARCALDCVYCGEVADTKDHVPPVSVAHYMDLDVEHILVPCCHECNSALHNLFLLTLAERAKHLRSHYETKYRKYNATVRWDEDEIEELDGGLKQFIRGSQAEYERLRERLKHLDNRTYHDASDLEAA